MIPLKDWPKELKKNWKQRLLFAIQYFSMASAIYLLYDEYYKEGYFFRPQDIAIFPSHEFLFTVLLTVSVVTGVVGWRKKTSTRRSHR